MASFFDRYYALILSLALPVPLWFGGVLTPPLRPGALRDGIIWSALLLALWLLVRKFPRYRLRGEWRAPTEREFRRYFRLMLAVLIIDFGSKALFFSWDRPYQVELFKNFGLHSVFHPTEFESFHIYLLLYFFYLFMIGPLYFRLANRTLDRLWINFCAIGLGGTLALVSERVLFDGVHNSFYFAGPLMWFCPPCASPRFISYAWTPADFFCHAVVLAIFLPIAAYFAPSPSPQRGTLESDRARSTRLQDTAP